MTDQSSIQTSNAGLIATFYGPRDELKGLGEWLAQGLRVEMGNYAAFDHSLDDLPLIAAQDTSVIQVTLSSEAHSAEEGWPSFCQRLSGILQEEDEKENEEKKIAAIWGYTLVYAAVTEENQLSDRKRKEALQRLLAHARPLHGKPATQAWRVNKINKIKPLAYSAVAGGHLWLTHLPLKEDGFNAATIYVALAPPASRAQLAQQVLLGANASLLMPDLIAHKGYRERRQYNLGHQSDRKHRYEKAADTILDNMGDLLYPTPEQTASQLVTQAKGDNATDKWHPAQEQIASRLDALTQEYSAFLPIVPRFKQLHVSIQRQLHNFERWKPENETCADAGSMRDILDLHHNLLDTTLADLDQLISKGEETLQVTKHAIDFVQTRLDKRRERRQQAIEIILAAMATAFTFGQILDRELISALTGLAIKEYTPLLSGIQVILAICFAIVGVTILNWWLGKQR